MNIYITYGILFFILLALELVYFKIADKCNIIDKPNERSSHSTIVLRGGGIIFPIAVIVWATLAVWCLPVHGIQWRCRNQASSLSRRMASTGRTVARQCSANALFQEPSYSH